MPRRVTVIETCDPCENEGQEVEATTTLVFSFNEGRPWPANKKPEEVLLCEVHQKEYVGTLEHLREFARTWSDGEKVAATRPSRAKNPGEDGGTPALTPSPGAPEGHMAKPIPDDKWPEDLPKPTVGSEGETVFKCPECTGVAQKEATFSTKDRKRPAQSARLHLRQQHGWDV